MKKQMVEICVYEPGDLLDISNVKALVCKPELDRAKRAIVLERRNNKNGSIGYKFLTEDLCTVRVKAEEMGKERYLKHFDAFNDLFELNGEMTDDEGMD